MKPSLVLFLFFITQFNSVGQVNTFYYDRIYPFRSGYALVELGDKFGIINTDFIEIIPPVLTSIKNYDLSAYYFDGLLYGKINDTLILFDTLGNRTKTVPRADLYPPVNWNESYKIDSLSILYIGGNGGCSLPNGKEIIPYEYHSIYLGLGDHLIARKREMYHEIIDHIGYPRYKEITVVYDRNGNCIDEFEGVLYTWLDRGVYFKSVLNGYQICNAKFEPIHNELYKNLITVDSLCWVETNLGWGLLNRAFEYKIKPSFEFVRKNKYFTVVGKDQKFGFYSQDGIPLTVIEYYGDWTQYYGDDSIIVAYKNDHLIFLNLQGKCIYNCDEPTHLLKYYPNGKLMVEGCYTDYWKTGTWNYYRNDALNSIYRTIEYTDSTLIYTELDTSGKIIDTWNQERFSLDNF